MPDILTWEEEERLIEEHNRKAVLYRILILLGFLAVIAFAVFMDREYRIVNWRSVGEVFLAVGVFIKLYFDKFIAAITAFFFCFKFRIRLG